MMQKRWMNLRSRLAHFYIALRTKLQMLQPRANSWESIVSGQGDALPLSLLLLPSVAECKHFGVLPTFGMLVVVQQCRSGLNGPCALCLVGLDTADAFA